MIFSIEEKAMRHEFIADVAEDIMARHGQIREEWTGVEDIQEKFIPTPKLGHPFKQYFRPGCYLAADTVYADTIPNPISLRENEKIFDFDCRTRREIQEEIKNFWEKTYETQIENIDHRQGIMIDGPPGSGKSKLIKQVIKGLVAENQVVFVVDNPYHMKKAISNFRSYEPDRPLTVVVEDIDEVTKYYGEQMFLETMDGLESTNHILFIATTNHLDQLSEKLTRRGRFGPKIHMPLPSNELREQYLIGKIRGREPLRRIKKIAQITEGFSFGDLKDLIRSVYSYKKDLRESLVGIRDEIKNRKSSNGK